MRRALTGAVIVLASVLHLAYAASDVGSKMVFGVFTEQVPLNTPSDS